MKILFLTHNFYPFVGGIEVNSEILARAYVEAGYNVKVVTWTPDPENTLFPFEVVRKPGLFELIRLHLWADLIFENNPSLRLSWPGLFIPRPFVVAVRTWISRIDGSTGIQDHIKKLHLKRANKVIAVSAAISSHCSGNAIVIGNPYRIGAFKVLPKIQRSKDFVFLGRLVSDKGADKAIEALYHINKSNRKMCSLTIIGDGPERDSLEDLVTRLNLRDFISFTGPLSGEDLTVSLNMHRFLLVPSVWEEPFGNVVLEGMACGCVPVVSNGGGLPDAVGNAGLTFQRGNLQDLISVIQRLLNDPQLVKSLRNKSANHLAAHHPDTIAQKYLEVIRSVAGYKEVVV